MITFPASRPVRLALGALAFLAAAPVLTRADGEISSLDRKFSTPPTLSTEAIALVQMLEEFHYNRASVQSTDYAELIPDYMLTLDPEHLFFLGTDEAGFSQQYGKDVYYNIKYLGNIDSAYDIFYTYRDRVSDRVKWVFSELKATPDLNTNETFRPDRAKAAWPQTRADADDLWRRRLKFELLQEILNKKTPAEAREIVRQRYETELKNVGEIEGSELAERYLSDLAQIYDPHSDYFSADTLEDFGIQMKLKLVGIGAVSAWNRTSAWSRRSSPEGRRTSDAS